MSDEFDQDTHPGNDPGEGTLTTFGIGWRIFVIVVLVGLAWMLPELLGLDEWVGLAVGTILGIGLFFTLGLGDVSRPPS